MVINLSKHTVVIFDLDDTLFEEHDFVLSGFRNIAGMYIGHEKKVFEQMIESFSRKENVFQNLINFMPDVTDNIDYLIHVYRNHIPAITLPEDSASFLALLKKQGCRTGLLSDGRSITQRNKLSALGLQNYFDLVVISEEFGSEKPELRNYKIFKDTFGEGEYICFGDNTNKDFITPNYLGWETIGVFDRGKNIHKQNLSLHKRYLPNFWINKFDEIIIS